QAAHCSAKTSEPRSTPPFPGGRPKPSSPASISHPAICSGVAIWPYPKCPGSAAWAKAPAATIMPAPSISKRLRELNIEHAPVGLDLPGLDRIVVIDRIRSALLAQFRNRRLNIAGFVD